MEDKMIYTDYDKEFHEWVRYHPADVSAVGVKTLLDEIERLQAVEKQAIEQSEAVQRDWLSPAEAEGFRATIAKLRADNRWRKYPDEKPEEKGEYLCCIGKEVFVSFYGDSWDGNLAFRSVIQPTHWRPLPASPESEG